MIPAATPKLAAARRHLARADCLRERAAFLRRELAGTERLASYHLREGGVPFWIRHGTPDVFSLDQAFVQGHFALPERLHALLDKPAVVDLGANIGLFGVAMLARHPSASVVSVEPDPDTLAVLKRTVASNERTAWTVVEAAAATADGTVPFAAGRFGVSRVEPGAADLVPSVDAFRHLQSADLVKLDIEGSEWPILLDERFAGLRAGVVHLEYHGHLCPFPDPRALAEQLLTEAGYRVDELVVTTPTEGILLAWREEA